MATKNMSYDHPQYIVNQGASGLLVLSAASTRRAAYTAFVQSVVRAVHLEVVVAGTATTGANVGHFLGIHNATGTATLQAAGDFGTNAAGVGTSVSVLTTLARGETYIVQNTGTDAGAIFSVGIEVRPVPGASVES
jgi:hypothetical protein